MFLSIIQTIIVPLIIGFFGNGIAVKRLEHKVELKKEQLEKVMEIYMKFMSLILLINDGHNIYIPMCTVYDEIEKSLIEESLIIPKDIMKSMNKLKEELKYFLDNLSVKNNYVVSEDYDNQINEISKYAGELKDLIQSKFGLAK
ncbi:MAG: hypothetical protein ABF630_09440 [Liquorilactobacillus sp.]